MQEIIKETELECGAKSYEILPIWVNSSMNFDEMLEAFKNIRNKE